MRLRRGSSASGVPVILGTLPLNEAEVAVAAADVAARIQALSLARELRTIAVVPAVGDEPLADTVLALARGLEGEGSPTAVVSVVGDGAGTAARVAELRHDHEYVLLAVPARGVALPAADGALVIAGGVAAASLARVDGVHVIGAVLLHSGAQHQSDPSVDDPGRAAELEPMSHVQVAAAPAAPRLDLGAELEQRLAAVAVQEAELEARARDLQSRQAQLAGLSARLADVEARERELEGLAAELELRAHGGAGSSSADVGIDTLLADKRALEQQVAHLEARTREHAAFGAELQLRETAVRRSEGELVAESAQAEQLARHEAQLRERDEALARREKQLAEAEAALDGTRRAVAQAVLEVSRRQQALAEREAEHIPPSVAPPEPPVAPRPMPTPASMQEATRPSSGPTLMELEDLVRDRPLDDPDRLLELEAYLYQLREHADAQGRLPAHLDGLVESVFGDLLER